MTLTGAVVDLDRLLEDRSPDGTDHTGALRAALDRAMSGRATRVAICGAMGSGRTRLVEQARREAGRRPMRVLATHGRSADSAIAHASLLTLLHPVVEHLEELPPTERDSLRAALDLRCADVDEPAARTGLWRLLTRLAEERPLLVAVDDSDQLDEATARLLAFALGRMDAQAVAAIVVADTWHDGNPLVAVVDQVIALDEVDADSLMRAVQALAPATDRVTRHIASFAAGDRTVAVELVRSLSADQRAGRAAWPLVPPHVPARFASAHSTLFATLDETAQTALAVVAADTTGDATVVRAALDALGCAGDPLARLHHDRHVAIEGTTISVRHALLEVAAYHRLHPAARRDVHHALAAAMTAPHHESARPWQLAEATDGRAADSAAAMTAVARLAAGRGDLREAAVAHERAAGLAERHEERSSSIVAALGLWTALSDAPAMRRLLAAPSADVATRIARSAAARWLEGDAAAVAELRAAAAAATTDERPLLDALFADAAFASGRVREAVDTARRVVQDNDADHPSHQLAAALLVLAGETPVATMSRPDPCRSIDAAGVVAQRATLRYAEGCLLTGDLDAVEQALGTGSAAEPAAWDPAERSALLARLSIAAGHPAAACQQLDAILARLPAGARLARAELGLVRAEALFLLGDGEAAMATLAEVVPVLRAAGSARLEATAQRLVGRIAWSIGQAEVALACLERARRIDPAAPVGDLVSLLAVLGRDHDARAWLDRIDRRPDDPAAPIDVLRARANMADDPSVFDAVVAEMHRRHLVTAEAEVLVDLTAWHHRRHRWADVLGTAERAARLLIPSGIKAWFGRLGALEPPAGFDADGVPDALIPLTDAERRVAMAVSRGISNREVAAELFISVKTVDSHLQRIYPKLGIRCRAELAALVSGGIGGRAGNALGPTTGNVPDARR